MCSIVLLNYWGLSKFPLFTPLWSSLSTSLFFHGVNKEIKNVTINGHFSIKDHRGSYFFRGHFSFHYCVPLIVGAFCQSLFLLWERCVTSTPHASLSPWPATFCIFCPSASPSPHLFGMDSYAGPDTRPAIHARQNKQPTGGPHRCGCHKVEDWRAISGCVFPIDGGKQAPWHHSPDPDISSDLQLRVPLSPFRPWT